MSPVVLQHAAIGVAPRALFGQCLAQLHQPRQPRVQEKASSRATIASSLLPGIRSSPPQRPHHQRSDQDGHHGRARPHGAGPGERCQRRSERPPPGQVRLADRRPARRWTRPWSRRAGPGSAGTRRRRLGDRTPPSLRAAKRVRRLNAEQRSRGLDVAQRPWWWCQRRSASAKGSILAFCHQTRSLPASWSAL